MYKTFKQVCRDILAALRNRFAILWGDSLTIPTQDGLRLKTPPDQVLRSDRRYQTKRAVYDTSRVQTLLVTPV
jgi:hypothetical protein